MTCRQSTAGQSAVEFVLIAPLLFLIFFLILQVTTLGLSCLAVQRAAMAVAREASLSGDAVMDPHAGIRATAQKLIALGPLTRLNGKAAWLCAAFSTCEVTHDRTTVTATVRYPMPLVMPLAGKVLGVSLDPGPAPPLSGNPDTLGFLLHCAGMTLPDWNALPRRRIPVRWIVFTARCFNEAAAVRP